jgi:membrane-bound ClpP family serine protease
MNANKALLVLGIAAVAIPFYDEVTFQINERTAITLPFIWKGTIAQSFSELWLAILGAILILIAAFIPFG